MPGTDLAIVFHWWTVLFLFGGVAFPLTKKLFSQWFDGGYLFSKAVSLAIVTWLVYVMGTVRIVPFSNLSIFISLLTVFLLGLVLSIRFKIYDLRFKNLKLIILEELFFFGALFLWAWVKGHEPSIRGLEKFMDYGFMKSILESTYFPPRDMWYAGSPINYYYFGHMVVAVLTKLSGIDLAYTFNLMLATIFAFTLTMSFSIGYQISRRWQAGLLTAFLVTLAGNMQTLYAFTRGYTGENVKPFWELAWGVGELLQKLPQGLNTYWYANATRFIPFTIHEFPSYSFVVSDIHGHVLSLPFVLLVIALVIRFFQGQALAGIKGLAFMVFYGFLVGVLLMTNAMDGPIYFALLGLVVFVGNWKKKWMILLTVFVVAGLVSLPFLSHFKSFVNGLAVNCPPEFLANTKIGPLLFEGVEKCQRSPLWMMTLLWGFFIYCGIWLLLRVKFTQVEKLMVIFFIFSAVLIIFPEFFYFKDIYPAHFRSNTMFKLGYQAFILFSIVSGYAIVRFVRKKLFLVFLLPQLFLVSIYPIFSVRSYFNSLRDYKGIYGLTWLQDEYPDDYAAIQWLNNETRDMRQETCENKILGFYPVACRLSPVAIVEADGDSYTDYNHFSAFTGMPTIVGWAVHEWLWRGGYEFVAPRREEVRLIYESGNPQQIRAILAKYNVRFILVGNLERQKFTNLKEDSFSIIGKPVFTYRTTVVYEIGQAGY